MFEGAFQNITAINIGPFSPIRGIAELFPTAQDPAQELVCDAGCVTGETDAPYAIASSSTLRVKGTRRSDGVRLFQETVPEKWADFGFLITDLSEAEFYGVEDSFTLMAPPKTPVDRSVGKFIARAERTPYDWGAIQAVKVPEEPVYKVGNRYGVRRVLVRRISLNVTTGTRKCFRIGVPGCLYGESVEVAPVPVLNYEEEYDARGIDAFELYGDGPDRFNSTEFFGPVPLLYETDESGVPKIVAKRQSDVTWDLSTLFEPTHYPELGENVAEASNYAVARPSRGLLMIWGDESTPMVVVG